jgi:glucokinase
LARAQYPSADYVSLEVMAAEFLATTHFTVDTACFAVAGPVIEGQAKVTNLSWVTSVTGVAAALHLRAVRLLNDLEAIAIAVPALDPTDVLVLNDGRATQFGPIAVIAPGTGLGEAFLTWDGTRYQAQPSEGGHADFAPTDDLQIELLRFLLRRFHHVSVERVCSGIGIPNIYDFLRDTAYAVEPPELAAQLAAAEDRTPIIMNTALDAPTGNSLCTTTLELFVSILGAEASNLALKVLATGGVYVAGGIPPRILPALQSGLFMKAFRNKGRFSELLGSIPVRMIVEPAGIMGAALYGLQLEAMK